LEKRRFGFTGAPFFFSCLVTLHIVSEQPHKPTKITVTKKGYLRVQGDFEVVNKKGVVIGKGKQPVNLCGCGLSKSWPICDDSHKDWKKPWKEKRKDK
jgi:CDGSH-type Zn-finger protein